MTRQSRIARERRLRDWTQADLARYTGIPIRTIQRIEQGVHPNPGIHYLTNIALALDIALEEILEPEWTSWRRFSQDTSRPPDDHGWA